MTPALTLLWNHPSSKVTGGAGRRGLSRAGGRAPAGGAAQVDPRWTPVGVQGGGPPAARMKLVLVVGPVVGGEDVQDLSRGVGHCKDGPAVGAWHLASGEVVLGLERPAAWTLQRDGHGSSLVRGARSPVALPSLALSSARLPSGWPPSALLPSALLPSGLPPSDRLSAALPSAALSAYEPSADGLPADRLSLMGSSSGW